MTNRVIFDWKRTLYDPDTKTLVKGTFDILDFLKNMGVKMVLMGKGGEDMNEEVGRFKLKKYFGKILFIEGEKDPKVFKPYVSSKDPRNTIFIGDRVRSELAIGNLLGATTIWVKQGKFASETPESNSQKPHYTVNSLVECLSILKNLC